MKREREDVVVMGKLFGFGARRRLGDVKFDGSHKGRSDPGPPDSQISLSLGGTHEGSEVPMMGPESGGARGRRSDRKVPSGGRGVSDGD